MLTGRGDSTIIILERIAIRVRVQESFRVLVLNSDRIEIADLYFFPIQEKSASTLLSFQDI